MTSVTHLSKNGTVPLKWSALQFLSGYIEAQGWSAERCDGGEGGGGRLPHWSFAAWRATAFVRDVARPTWAWVAVMEHTWMVKPSS